MPERFDDLAVTVTSPPGWQVRVGERPRLVALVRDEDRDLEPPDLGSLSIQLAPPGDLDTASAVAMRRYVLQGWPDYARVFVQGRHAHRYRWTDGVRSIVTWFVEAGDRVLEIHADVGPHAEPGAELLQGAMLLRHLTLDPPAHAAFRLPVRIPAPLSDRTLELADANVLAVRRHDDNAEVLVTTRREEHVVLRFRGVIDTIDRSPGEIAGLLQIAEGDAAVEIDRYARRHDDAHVIFAFTNASEDAVVEVVCEAAALELTVEVASS